MKLLDRINRTGTTVVMATHDVGIVDQMRRRVIELDHGHLVRDQGERHLWIWRRSPVVDPWRPVVAVGADDDDEIYEPVTDRVAAVRAAGVSR